VTLGDTVVAIDTVADPVALDAMDVVFA